MSEPSVEQDLLAYFKALADANRLKIVGLLAQKDYTVEELAELLDLRASTVSHHLSRLSKAGLVSARAQSYYSIYHLEAKAIERLAKTLLSADTLPAVAADVDLNAYDRKVVTDFTGKDGMLKTIPAQRKKLEAVLRYLVKDFEPGQIYSEKQVNAVLARHHEDTASLRRELIGADMMAREPHGATYWRVESS
jgi:DNA-binding HxlR family transcriptional regulator